MAETPAAPAKTGAGQSRRAGGAGRAKRIGIRALLLALVAVVIGSGLWLLFVFNFSYSNGERAGHLQKLSHRGWVCKTWEGELLLTTLPGVVPEKFAFTVRDAAVARAVQEQIGQRVTLTYEQHQGVPRCFGETEYYVTAVRRLGP